MKQGTAKLAEVYCFIHEALRPVGKARRQIAAVPPSNSRPAMCNVPSCQAVMRNLVYRFTIRVDRSENKLLCAIGSSDMRYQSRIKKHWMSRHSIKSMCIFVHEYYCYSFFCYLVFYSGPLYCRHATISWGKSVFFQRKSVSIRILHLCIDVHSENVHAIHIAMQFTKNRDIV